MITIDELDNSKEMKSFIENYSLLLREGFGPRLLMTGLYENISQLQNDKSLTFLYRCPKIYLSSLSINSISLSYQDLLIINENEALKLAKLTKGYAYAYQVLGYLLFKEDKRELTKTVLSIFDQYLKEYVYDKIYSQLSEKEVELLLLFNDNGKQKISDLLKASNIKDKSFSVYRDRLIKKGILISSIRGTIEFALPRFYEFLKTK